MSGFNNRTGRSICWTEQPEVEQVVVAEACTSPDRRVKSGLSWRAEGSAEGSTPSLQCSPASCTGDGARYTVHHHVQIRDDEGGHGASTSGHRCRHCRYRHAHRHTRPGVAARPVIIWSAGRTEALPASTALGSIVEKSCARRRLLWVVQASGNLLPTVAVVCGSIAIRRARSPRMSTNSGSPRPEGLRP